MRRIKEVRSAKIGVACFSQALSKSRRLLSGDVRYKSDTSSVFNTNYLLFLRAPQ